MRIGRRAARRRSALALTALLALAAPLAAAYDDPAPPEDTVTTVGAVTTDGPAPPTPAAAPTPRTASIVMGGDLLWHDTVWTSAAEDHAVTGRGRRYDFDPMFAALRPMLAAADLALCHEEVPFAAPGQRPASYPVFAAPRAIAPWIASMGWDACTTASNHSWDQGFAGLTITDDLLEANGVAHVGTFRSAAERRRPVIITTDQGVRVGIVAATYGLNGFGLPRDRWWAVSQTSEVRDGLLAQAARARAAGADIVVAHVHWGDEYDHAPSADQVALARTLTRSADIDLVLGEHAHVVQPITKVNGTWVVYGLGNMVAQSETGRPGTYEGITVEFRFAERADGSWRVTRAAYVPTQWGHYRPGSPIRIGPATGGHLASVRHAVHAAGHSRGLVERRLPTS